MPSQTVQVNGVSPQQSLLLGGVELHLLHQFQDAPEVYQAWGVPTRVLDAGSQLSVE